jgi:hypothetical protein
MPDDISPPIAKIGIAAYNKADLAVQHAACVIVVRQDRNLQGSFIAHVAILAHTERAAQIARFFVSKPDAHTLEAQTLR